LGLFSFILRKFNMDALWITSPYSAEKKQADRLLFGYGDDRICKYSTTGGAIAF
jgi:uncharacterized protein YycO